MVTIMTALATPERWDDVQRTLTSGGDGRSCQCQWPVFRASEFDRMRSSEREEHFRNEIGAGPPPGIVGYVDDEAAGWVRIGPRIRQARLARTRMIVQSTQEPLDAIDVWAVTCFSVPRGHRRQGLTSALLEAAVDHARDSGARVIEAYPIDTSVQATTSNDLFHGALSTFLAAGFHEIARPKPNRPVVALDLTS